MSDTTTGISLQGLCRYCNGIHAGTCPRIAEIEYHKDGTVKRVRFHEPTTGIGGGESHR